MVCLRISVPALLSFLPTSERNIETNYATVLNRHTSTSQKFKTFLSPTQTRVQAEKSYALLLYVGLLLLLIDCCYSQDTFISRKTIGTEPEQGLGTRLTSQYIVARRRSEVKRLLWRNIVIGTTYLRYTQKTMHSTVFCNPTWSCLLRSLVIAVEKPKHLEP